MGGIFGGMTFTGKEEVTGVPDLVRALGDMYQTELMTIGHITRPTFWVLHRNGAITVFNEPDVDDMWNPSERCISRIIAAMAEDGKAVLSTSKADTMRGGKRVGVLIMSWQTAAERRWWIKKIKHDDNNPWQEVSLPDDEIKNLGIRATDLWREKQIQSN